MTEEIAREYVMTRAMKDSAFRQALLRNPRAVLAAECHLHLPQEVTIRVLEEQPDTLTLVLPHRQEALLDLSDAALEAVSGGTDRYGAIKWTYTPQKRTDGSSQGNTGMR